MKEFSVSNTEKLRRIDPVILLCVLGMNVMSVVTLASASDKFGTWYVKVQSLTSVVGIGLMMLIMMVDYDGFIQRFKKLFYPVSVLLILWVKFFGSGSMGNNNWITIPYTPISIQPTEFVKITFIISFAIHLDKLRDNLNQPLSILGLAVHAGSIIALVLWQGDTGMALVYMAFIVIMIFGAGVSLWYFAGVMGAGIIAAPFLWKHLSEIQQKRILFGFNPDLDPLDGGWNAIASRTCIIAGGFRGAGFSGGSKYKSLFAGQSDFCFAVLAEKFGFIGTFLYVSLMAVLVLRILWLSRRTRKKCASYICIGIAGMLIAQAGENIGMCLAILPVVGITLPFMSYGTSSLLSMYICIGILQSISAHNDKYYFERELE